MKLTCSKDLLLQYINIVNKAVSNRTTLPILECILLTANERGCEVVENSAFARNDRENYIWKTLWIIPDNRLSCPRFPQ